MPHIVATANSREFQVMLDVINNVGLVQARKPSILQVVGAIIYCKMMLTLHLISLQAPDVKSVYHDVQLMQEPESYEIANMRNSYAALRNYLTALMAEVGTLHQANSAPAPLT